MKEKILIKASAADAITYYHLLVFSVSLPFNRLYSELALISLLIHTFIHLTREQLHQVSLKTVLLPGAIFLVTVSGTIYTGFLSDALMQWERQLALLLLPLVVLYNRFDFYRYRFNFILALSVSCSATVVYLYYMAWDIIRFNHLPLRSVFSSAFLNHNFSLPVDMHATYLSMYIALAALGMIAALFTVEKTAEKILYLLLLAILLAGLFQLSSRAVWIAFALVVNVLIPVIFLTKKKAMVYVLIAVSASLLGFYAVTKTTDLKTRIITDFKTDLSDTTINSSLSEPRMKRWECAWELIKISPLYGYGTGAEIKMLGNCYFQKGFYSSYLHELNAHNQYLSFLLQAGIAGLFVFLWVMAAAFRLAWQRKDFIFLGFLVICAAVSFSENLLDVNKGIFFFAFFYALFYTGSKKTTTGLRVAA